MASSLRIDVLNIEAQASDVQFTPSEKFCP